MDEFLLDGLQPFLPLAVSDVRLCILVALKPMSLVQFLNLSNLLAETPDLFPENFEMIHKY